MKLWQKILLGLVASVALLFVIALLLPSKWRVETTVVIKARPEAVAPLLVDLKRWKEWAAWNNEMDPTLQTTYSGPPTGPGATMSWKGERMGFGTLTITESDPQKGVRYEMTMEEQQTPARGQIALAPEGEGTRVTWLDEGDMGSFLPGRYFVPMMERQLGEHCAMGLRKLKAAVEGTAAGGAAR